MKKNNYNTNSHKYSKINKYSRTKSNSLSNNIHLKKTQNEQKKEIPIIDLLKCPICKKICLMNINIDQLLFSFECNNKHIINMQKSKTVQTGENNFSNISDLNISQENLRMLNKDNNTSYTSSLISKKNNPIPKIYITEKDSYCQKHPSSKYHSYCYECKENICLECLKEHLNHNKIELNIIKPKEDEVILYQSDIKKNEEELNNVIDNIMKWQKEFEYGLNTIIKIMQNISNLRQFIILNYDLKQSNQNYNYIQNFNNMKVLNFIFPELLEFLKEPDWKQKGHILIEIIVNIQAKIIKNKEKIEENRLKKEAEKLKENLENQEKLLKSKKKVINPEGNEAEEKGHLHKRKYFNTTFNSDCMNNNYFCSISSKEAINNKHTKKKVVERRNKMQNSENFLTHTIEQNKELEKNINIPDENKNGKMNEENNLSKEPQINFEPSMIKIAQSSINNINNNNTDNISVNMNDNQNISDNNIKVNNEQNYNNKNDVNNDPLNEVNNNIKENNNLNNSINDINKIDNNKYNNKKILSTEEKNNNLDNINEDINLDHQSDINNIEVLKNIKKPLEINNIYKNLDLKYELLNTDIIRSIEFINSDFILISTLENISIYKMNSNYELIKECDIKEFNYRINYATQLSNGNLVICSLNYINIIKLSEDQSLSHTLIQKLNGKNNSDNINKVIEIKEKNYLISCDKNNLIIYSKNNETNLYEENKFLNINSEVKCLESINENIFVTVEPEKECVIFYDIENIENKFVINNIQSSFGRYVISYLKKHNYVFITGRQGIYLISTEKYKLITFFKVNEWISSINYDYFNDYLICGTWKKNSINGQKIYNLIIYEINENDLENKGVSNMNIKEIVRKNNVHLLDIVVIKHSKQGIILTGSNDKTVKLWI